MMQVNGTVPANMAIDEVTVTELSTEHVFNHSLGDAPDIIFLLAKTEPQGTGNSNPAFFHGWNIANSTTYSDYKRIFTNFKTTSGWDYSATYYGWLGNAQNVQIKMSSGSRLPVGTYYLITYKFS